MEDGLTETVRYTLGGRGDRDHMVSDLGGLNGVRNVTVSPDGKSVDVAMDSTVLDPNAVREAIEAAGYNVTDMSQGAPAGNTEGNLW